MYAPYAHVLLAESNAPPFLTKRSSAARTALLAFLVIVVSYLAAWLGATMLVSSLGLSVLWPPLALLVAAMLLVPRRNWLVLVPAGLAGAAVENLQLGFTLGSTGLFFLANTIEVLIIGLGLGYSFDGVPRLNSLKALGKYCFFAKSSRQPSRPMIPAASPHSSVSSGLQTLEETTFTATSSFATTRTKQTSLNHTLPRNPWGAMIHVTCGSGWQPMKRKPADTS
jgi:hypothetical protein